MNLVEWIEANASLIEAKFGRNETERYIFGNVSHTQLSVARHYGGCRVNNAYYDYAAEHDLLIREDVLQWIRKQIKVIEMTDRELGKSHRRYGSGCNYV